MRPISQLSAYLAEFTVKIWKSREQPLFFLKNEMKIVHEREGGNIVLMGNAVQCWVRWLVG